MCRLSLWLASTTYISRASQGNNFVVWLSQSCYLTFFSTSSYNHRKIHINNSEDLSHLYTHTSHIASDFLLIFFVSYNVCIPHPPPTTWRCVSHSSFLIHKWRMRLSEGDNQSIMRRVFSHRKSPSHTFFSLKNEEKLTIVIVIEGFAFFLVLFGSFWKRWFFSLAAHSFILQLYHIFI